MEDENLFFKYYPVAAYQDDRSSTHHIWPLNNMGLNYTDPLIHRFFFPYKNLYCFLLAHMGRGLQDG